MCGGLSVPKRFLNAIKTRFATFDLALAREVRFGRVTDSKPPSRKRGRLQGTLKREDINAVIRRDVIRMNESTCNLPGSDFDYNSRAARETLNYKMFRTPPCTAVRAVVCRFQDLLPCK